MDDSEVNPMRTGLMFVPLGLVISPGWPAPSRSRGHLAELLAELEAVTDHDAPAPAIALEEARRPAFRRLLERLRHIARRYLPLPT